MPIRSLPLDTNEMKAVIQKQEAGNRCNYFVRHAPSINAIEKTGALIVNDLTDPVWSQIEHLSYLSGESPKHWVDITFEGEYQNFGDVKIESIFEIEL